jgi:DNA-binding transcriptional LysR family regulator
MNLYELEVLLTVVETGGFNKAAQRLHVTQPAVSHAIRRLEERIGGPLLLRTTPPAPTPAGRRVLEYAREALEGSQRLERDLADLAHPTPPRLRLGVSQSVTQLHLPRVLEDFLASHEYAPLDVVTRPSRELIPQVLDGELDMAFGPFQKHMHRLQRQEYLQAPYHLYMGRSHPLARKLARGDADALRQTILLTAYLDPLENRPARDRLRFQFKGIWQLTSLPLRFALIAGGRGIGYLPEPWVKAREDRKEVRTLKKFPFGTIHRAVGLYYRRKGDLSDSAQRFVDSCNRVFQAASG